MKYFFLALVFLMHFSSLDGQEPSSKDALLKLGNYYWEKSEEFFPSNFDSCIYYTKAAQTQFEKAQAWPQFVNCSNGLSTLYYYKGDFQLYVKQAQKALAQAKQHLNDRSNAYASALNNLGSFYMSKGDNDQAIELYKNSVKIQETSNDPSINLVQISNIYKNLGTVYEKKKDYFEGLRFYKKAFATKVKDGKGNTALASDNLFDIGHCYYQMGLQDSTTFYFNKSLDILKSLDINGDYNQKVAINCYHGLAKAAIATKLSTKSLFYIEKALDLQPTADSHRKEYSFELLGRHYLTLNDEKAIKHLNTSIESYQEKYPQRKKHHILARLYQQIAKFYQEQGQYQKALQNYQTALQKLAFKFESDEVAQNPEIQHLLSQAEAVDILDGKAQCLIELAPENPTANYRQMAHQCYQMAKTLIRNLRNDYLANGSKHILAGKVLPIYEHAIENALALYQQKEDQAFLYDAFDSAESNKALLLLETLNDRAAKHNSGIPDSLLAKENDLTIDLAFYNRKIQEEKQKGERAKKDKILQWEAHHFDLQKSYQDLIATLEDQFPKYYAAKYNHQLVDPKAIQQALPEGGVLLEYFMGEKQNFLFQLTKDQLLVQTVQLDRIQQEGIQSFRQLVMNPPRHQSAVEDFQLFTQLGQQFYQQLLAPALSTAREIQQLIIIPDPILALLPFELLLYEGVSSTDVEYAPDVLPYLFRKYAISYDYSASIFMKNHQQSLRPTNKTFVGLAPSFNDAIAMTERSCQGNELYSLQCSEEEIQNIQALFGGETHSGITASKAFFMAHANEYQILHLATHACVDDNNPMLNRIFFTDDYLSNYELSALQLNAELAVLSACNTGAGKLIRGEGVMSLARSFVQAGCPSTIMSLWPINDCSTSSIMQYFYQSLEEGLEKNEALKQAKLRFLGSAGKEERHPYYWAAFVQFGRTQPIDAGSNGLTLGLWAGIAILALLLVFFFFRRQRQ